MRHGSLAFVILGLVTAGAALGVALEVESRESSYQRTKTELVELEKKSWEAWKSRDGKFFEGFLSDDHVELGFYGPAHKADVVATVASPRCAVDHYAVDRFELTVLDPHTAVLTYHAAQSTLCNGTPVPSPVWVTSLYVKRNGRWRNALYQQTQDLRR